MTPDEIWEGDFFRRREEAEQLIGYLETVAMRPSLREDGHAYVMTIDAPYGEGKSFFLRRFAQHMSLTHPVAFVDAWVDDLEDEPLVALAATLDDALSGLADESGKLHKKVAAFKTKATAVAKIVGIGLLKRVASLLIMESGAEAAHTAISNVSDTAKDLGRDVLKDASNDAVNDAVKAATEIVGSNMDERIQRFREGRVAIEGMKAALRAIVQHLSEEGVYPPPIVIVIDELDRCRPTYAIKLLEEIKHLFDVEGVAFVLGTHGSALSHSVSAAYGNKFDGEAYLRRFFNRTYRLADAGLSPLVQWLFQQRGIDVTRLRTPGIRLANSTRSLRDPAHAVALYMQFYGFNARDAFAVTDSLETCLALTGRAILYVPYLLPLLLAHLRGQFTLINPLKAAGWVIFEQDQWGNAAQDIEPHSFATDLAGEVARTDSELMVAANHDNPRLSAQIIAGLTFGAENQANDLGRPQGYSELLRTVGRFQAAS